MKIQTKVVLTSDSLEPFMGVGVLWLLERIDRLGSIKAAAGEMRMSYAKALKMIKGLEKNLSQEIVVSHIGGLRGGGSYLTPFAYKFLRQYRQMDSDVKKFALRRFRQFQRAIK